MWWSWSSQCCKRPRLLIAEQIEIPELKSKGVCFGDYSIIVWKLAQANICLTPRSTCTSGSQHTAKVPYRVHKWMTCDRSNVWARAETTGSKIPWYLENVTLPRSQPEGLRNESVGPYHSTCIVNASGSSRLVSCIVSRGKRNASNGNSNWVNGA